MGQLYFCPAEYTTKTKPKLTKKLTLTETLKKTKGLGLGLGLGLGSGLGPVFRFVLVVYSTGNFVGTFSCLSRSYLVFTD